MEINETPKLKISLPDLDNLPQYIKANKGRIRLDASYNHLGTEKALDQMEKQAQQVVTDFRKLGRPDEEIQKIVAKYLIGPVNEGPTLKDR